MQNYFDEKISRNARITVQWLNREKYQKFMMEFPRDSVIKLVSQWTPSDDNFFS